MRKSISGEASLTGRDSLSPGRKHREEKEIISIPIPFLIWSDTGQRFMEPTALRIP